MAYVPKYVRLSQGLSIHISKLKAVNVSICPSDKQYTHSQLTYEHQIFNSTAIPISIPVVFIPYSTRTLVNFPRLCLSGIVINIIEPRNQLPVLKLWLECSKVIVSFHYILVMCTMSMQREVQFCHLCGLGNRKEFLCMRKQ